jgi:hypothetical protein
MKGPRHDEATRLKQDAERARREREESFAAIRNALRQHVPEALQHANPVDRVQSLLNKFGFTGWRNEPLRVKTGDRCHQCSTPARHRQMTVVEAAAVELSELPAAARPLERWCATGRVCPDPNCGCSFLEIIIQPTIQTRS